MHKYDTLAYATESLMNRGYNINFNVNNKGKLSNSKDLEFEPSEVILMEIHRFEGMSNPADNSILYAVETRTGEKGIVIDSYGADGSKITSDFMNKVEQRRID